MGGGARLDRLRGRKELSGRSPSAPMIDARRSEGKEGSGGDSRLPRRHVKRGSWMNYFKKVQINLTEIWF